MKTVREAVRLVLPVLVLTLTTATIHAQPVVKGNAICPAIAASFACSNNPAIFCNPTAFNPLADCGHVAATCDLQSAGVPATCDYCISGISDGNTYAWWIDYSNDGLNILTEPFNNTAGPVANNSPAQQLAADFAASITAAGASGLTAAVTTPNNCFTITSNTTFGLEVGGATPVCPVTSVGCTYNPTITLGPAPPISVPALGTRGIVLLSLLLMSTFWFVLRRRSATRG